MVAMQIFRKFTNSFRLPRTISILVLQVFTVCPLGAPMKSNQVFLVSLL